MDREKLINDTTLMLIYPTSWKGDMHVGTVTRSWRGYDWSIIDALCDESLINASHRAKSVYLTDQGGARQTAHGFPRGLRCRRCRDGALAV